MGFICSKVILGLSLSLYSLLSVADCVVLLHGLARTSASMGKLEAELHSKKYSVVNVNYPSRDSTVQQLADTYVAAGLGQCPKHQDVHFVTHSMGGILVRQYLRDHKIKQLGRVVMLGPPNRGSEVVDKLGAFPGFHFINGDAGLELGTGQLSIPNSLGAADFEVGIIAGSRSINLVLSSLIPGKDDGKVAVERTKLEGMSDHLIMPVTHTFMMRNDAAIEQTVYFLAHGEFAREAELGQVGQE